MILPFPAMAYERPLQILGLLAILYFCIKICSLIWLYIRPSSIHYYLKDTRDSKDGNWALVTGASDGLGQAFANELCGRGFHVVLHGRNPTKLEKVQKELKQRHPESLTRIVVFDANLSPSTSLERDIHDRVKDLRLSVLINNVGGTAGVQSASETFSTIDKHSIEAVNGLLNINARFTTQITRLLLPLLLQRPRCLIMNISSAAEWGMPYLSVYSGTKAYITTWSKALTAEMKAEERNAEVLGIVVGSVQTISNDHPLSVFHPPAKTFVKAALDRVGCGKASVYGYLPHALQSMSLAFFPEWIAETVTIRTMEGLKDAADIKAKNS